MSWWKTSARGNFCFHQSFQPVSPMQLSSTVHGSRWHLVLKEQTAGRRKSALSSSTAGQGRQQKAESVFCFLQLALEGVDRLQVTKWEERKVHAEIYVGCFLML